jgi:hypothetical protein
MRRREIQNKQKREYNWAYRNELELPNIRESIVGDMFAAQNKETKDIEACYVRKLPKGKRHFQCMEGGGFVSPYDMECMHSNCDFVWYAKE